LRRARVQRSYGWSARVHDALNPFGQARRSKIDQQAYGQIEEPQIRQHLLAMNARELFDGLQFDDDSTLDEEIHTERFVESHSFEFEHNRLLPFDMETALLECSREHGFVDGFQQSRADPCVKVVRRTYDRAGDFVDFSHA
jgi:hypothetical protein